VGHFGLDVLAERLFGRGFHQRHVTSPE
jgi:hypothetical protein